MSLSLIDEFVADLCPVRCGGQARLLAAALVAGAGVSLAMIIGFLGIQPDLMSVDHGAPVLMKLAYCGLTAAVAVAAVLLLGHPGHRRPRCEWLGLPFIPLATLAVVQLAGSVPSSAAHQLMGSSWSQCPTFIVLFAVLPMIALTIATRREAPTQLRIAESTLDLCSGAFSAGVYAIACPETSAAFVLLWYSVGIATTATIGALIGPVLLRW